MFQGVFIDEEQGDGENFIGLMDIYFKQNDLIG